MTKNDLRDRSVVRLHLVRHAHAGDPLRWDGPDAARPLSDKGHVQASDLGAFLAAAKVRPGRIVTSPKVRARQTADAVGAALRLEPEEDDRLAVDCDLPTLESILEDATSPEVMVVGHDPYLSEVLSELVGAAGQVMRKGAIATIDAPRPLRGGSGLLRWLIPPEILPRSRTR
jgi:phosphohistidine phosphatase SixA